METFKPGDYVEVVASDEVSLPIYMLGFRGFVTSPLRAPTLGAGEMVWSNVHEVVFDHIIAELVPHVLRKLPPAPDTAASWDEALWRPSAVSV